MKLENLKINPYGKSLDPCLHLSFELVAERPFYVPIRYLGFVFSGQYRIAVLDEFNFEHSNEPDIGELENYGGHDKTFTYSKVFTGNLSPAAIKQIEKSRNEKGDIELDIRLKVFCLRSDFSTFKASDNQSKEHELLSLKFGKLVSHYSFSYNINHRITSSDWIHDFVPVFNNLTYQVFEIPQPEVLNTHTLIKQKMKEAIDALPALEEARAKGDWNLLIKESRPIWELANNREDLEATFQGELNAETWGVLKDLIQSFFTFSSKFIHRMNQNRELMPTNNASKADAELVYAMAFSIVNFISNKLK